MEPPCVLFGESDECVAEKTAAVLEQGLQPILCVGESLEQRSDGETLEVIDYIMTGQRVWQLAFTPDEKYLLTTNGNSNDITVIDVAEEKAIKSVQVGQQPWGVVVIE